MVGLFTGGSKQHVQGIVDDLGDGAIMGKNDIGHARKILIEQWPEYAGLQRFDEGRETSDVGEKRCDFTALPAEIEGISIPGKTLGEVWREIPRQGRIGSFGFSLSPMSLTQIFDVPHRLGDGG